MQEEVGPQASLGEDVVLGKKGDVDDLYKNETSSPCHCKMKILQVEPIAENDYWYFRDFTDPSYSPSFIHYGYGNNYESGTLPLPYYQNLAPPDAGCHKFLFTFNPDPETGTDPNLVTLHTEVRCYKQNADGTETLATTTWHDFTWGDGAPINMPGYENSRFFWRQFSCEYLTAGEEDCTPDPRSY